MYSIIEKIVECSHPDVFSRDFKTLKQKRNYILTDTGSIKLILGPMPYIPQTTHSFHSLSNSLILSVVQKILLEGNWRQAVGLMQG